MTDALMRIHTLRPDDVIMTDYAKKQSNEQKNFSDILDKNLNV